jgi:hypothetical protein
MVPIVLCCGTATLSDDLAGSHQDRGRVGWMESDQKAPKSDGEGEWENSRRQHQGEQMSWTHSLITGEIGEEERGRPNEAWYD